MAHHLIFAADAVAAVHVARHPGDIERLADVVALDDRDHLGCEPPLVHQATDAQRGLQAECDLGLHVGELLLVKLATGKRGAELLAVEAVLAGGVEAEFRGAQCAPTDAVARAIEAAEWTLQPLDIGQQRVLADLDILHHDAAGDRGA